jgi:hypothetical protein
MNNVFVEAIGLDWRQIRSKLISEPASTCCAATDHVRHFASDPLARRLGALGALAGITPALFLLETLRSFPPTMSIALDKRDR